MAPGTIASGGMPTVPVGFRSDGEFLVPRSSTGGMPLELQWSLDGVTWDNPDLLGDAPITGLKAVIDSTYVLALRVSPSQLGSVDFFVRSVLPDGTFGPAFATSLLCASGGSGEGMALQVERRGDTGTSWVRPDGHVAGVTADGKIIYLPQSFHWREHRFGGETGYEVPAARLYVLNPDGSLAWYATSSIGNITNSRAVVLDDGSVAVLMRAGSSSTTLFNYDGTAALTVSSNMPGATSFWTLGRVKDGVWLHATQIGLQSSAPALIAAGNTVAVVKTTATSETGLNVGDTFYPFPASRPATSIAVVAFDLQLSARWAYGWLRGFIRTAEVDDSGRVWVFTSSASSSSVAGVVADAPNGAVAIINTAGTVEAHLSVENGTGGGSNWRVIVPTSDGAEIFTHRNLSSSGTITSGAFTQTVPGGVTQIQTSVRSSGSGWVVTNLVAQAHASRVVRFMLQRRGSEALVISDSVTGITEYEYSVLNASSGLTTVPATFTRPIFRGGFDSSLTSYIWALGRISSTASNEILEDSTQQITIPQNTSFIYSLSPDGIWGEAAGVFSPPEGPISAPIADWPDKLDPGQPLIVTVTGFDPDFASSEAVLDLLIDDQLFTLSPAAISYKGGTAQASSQGTDAIAVGLTFIWTPDDFVFSGSRQFALRWGVIDFDPANPGIIVGVRSGPTATFTTTWTDGDLDIEPSDLLRPTGIEGTFPSFAEDTIGQGSFTFANDPVQSGLYTWELTQDPSYEEGVVGASVALTLPEGPVYATARIVAQGATGIIEIEPTPNWFGTGAVSLRVSNGVIPSRWVTRFFNVLPVEDDPSVPTASLPTLVEGGTAEFAVTWKDVDVDPLDIGIEPPAGAAPYTVELGLVTTNANGALVPAAWSTTGLLDAGKVIVRELSKSETSLSATLRVEGKARQSGTYRLALRVRRTTGTQRVSPWRIFTGAITDVNNPPTRVTGRMPHARRGETVEGLFRTTDDFEEGPWSFSIASSADGPYASSVTVSGVGVLTVIDDDQSDLEARVRLVQDAGSTAETSYTFWIVASDGSGLTSDPVQIFGTVGTPAAGVWLQKLNRSADSATVEKIAPLRGVTYLAFMDALEGPGQAEVRVDAGEIRRRAADAGQSVQAFLETGVVELRISLGTGALFVGPLVEVEWDAGNPEVKLFARGLMSYFDSRFLPDGAEFINADIATVVSSLVGTVQQAAYGDLAITDGTSAAGTNTTIDFGPQTRLLDAFRDLGKMVGAPEVWVTGDRVLHTSLARGSDQRSRVRITSGMASIASWVERSEGVVTVAYVEGEEDGNGGRFGGSFEDVSAMATFGRVERRFSTGLLSDAACAALADRIVKASSAASQSLQLELLVRRETPFTVADLGVGDVVRVDLQDERFGRLNDAFRIVNREAILVEQDSGTFRVTLDLEPARFVDGLLVGSRSRHNARVFTSLSDVEVLLGLSR